MKQVFAGAFPDGERIILDVTALNAELDRTSAPTVGAKVDEALKRQVAENGIEVDHLDRLRGGEPNFTPATMILRDGIAWIVDGNHRASLWIAAGSPAIPVRVADEPMWRRFLIQKDVDHAQPD